MESGEISLSLQWGAAVVVTISATGLAIVYRKSLKRFLEKAAVKIRINVFGIITIDVEKLLNMEEQVKGTGVLQPAVSSYANVAQDSESEGADLLARDAVIQSWASLKQIINDAVLAQKIQLTPSAEVTEAVQRLVSANVLSKSLAQFIIVLYEEGKRTADHPGKKMYKKQAVFYQQLINNIIDWIMRNIITPKPVVKPPPPPRRTMVGGYFPPPSQGQPAAILITVTGALKGRQFPLEKEVVRIGASSDNDIVIAGDDYVSRKHACIRYDKGSLLLADQHSRNSTFLNENQLKDIAMTINPGDRIRIGNSTFEVMQAPGR